MLFAISGYPELLTQDLVSMARGCREVQGFLFSQPLAPERFAKLLKVHGVGGVGAPDWPVTRSKGRGDARGGLQPD